MATLTPEAPDLEVQSATRSLERVRQLNIEMSAKLDQHFFAACNGATETKRICVEMGELAGRGVADEVAAGLLAFEGHLDQIAGVVTQVARSLSVVTGKVRAVQRLSEFLAEIAFESEMLALNAAIEGSTIGGDAGGEIVQVAQGWRQRNTHLLGLVREVQHVVDRIVPDLNEVVETLLNITIRVEHMEGAAQVRRSEVRASITDQQERARMLSAQLTRVATGIDGAAKEALQALQYDDIVSQLAIELVTVFEGTSVNAEIKDTVVQQQDMSAGSMELF